MSARRVAGAPLSAWIVLAIMPSLAGHPARAGDCFPVQLDPQPARVLWRAEGVISVKTAGDTLIMKTRDALRAVDPASGREIWSYPLGENDRHAGYVALESEIVVSLGQRLDFLDRSTGELLFSVDMGEWVQYLVGPPLVAVSRIPDADWSTLSRITEDGQITSTAFVDPVSSIILLDGVAVVESDSRFVETPPVLSGFALDPIEPLWSVESPTFNLEVVDGLLYFGDVFWRDGAHPIDVRTGDLGRPVPPRAAYPIGGSGAFDIQVTDSISGGMWQPDYADCERLRRNDIVTGAPRWNVDLPFHVNDVKGILREDDVLYVAGNHDPENRFLVALDWKNGRVLHAWTGLPRFWVLEKTGDIVFGYDHGGALAAVSVTGGEDR